VFDALYEERERQALKKQLLVARYFDEENSSFHPNIPQRSARLADKRRKKKFYGAAVHSSAAAQLEREREEEDGEEEDYHSAREGGVGGDLLSRRSSLETVPSPRDPTGADDAELGALERNHLSGSEDKSSFPSPSSSVPILSRPLSREGGGALAKQPSLFDSLYEVSDLPPALPISSLSSPSSGAEAVREVQRGFSSEILFQALLPPRHWHRSSPCRGEQCGRILSKVPAPSPPALSPHSLLPADSMTTTSLRSNTCRSWRPERGSEWARHTPRE
jgi:hypothetical protein